MKKYTIKIILTSIVLLIVATTEAAIVNAYEYGTTLSALSIQPQTNDLAQLSGSTNLIVKGGIHPSTSGILNYWFNSGGIGDLGYGTAIFQDGTSPAGDTIIHCDFSEPKTIGEVHIFSSWSDARVFTWFEVWASTMGTNDSDYTYLGTATFGAIGDVASSYPYTGECLARLYDDSDGVLADNVTSLRLIQKAVGNPNSPYDKKSPSSSATYVGAAVQEIDIIGIYREDNMVDNHSFNEGLNGNENSSFPADWNVGIGSGGSAGVERIFDDSADAGTNCFQEFTNVKGDDNINALMITVPDSRMYLGGISEVNWYFSYKFFKNGPGNLSGQARIQFRCWNKDDTFIGEDNVLPSVSVMTSWATISTRTFALPANTAYADIMVSCDLFEDFEGVLRVDNFNVTPVSSQPTQVTDIASDSPGHTSIDLSWDNGSGNGRLILCREGSAPPSSSPIDGMDYKVNSTFGTSGTALGDGYVVYKGTGNSVTIDGLTANTEYYFRAFEYNGNTVPNYNTATATDNPKSITTTPEPGMFFGMIFFGLTLLRRW